MAIMGSKELEAALRAEVERSSRLWRVRCSAPDGAGQRVPFVLEVRARDWQGAHSAALRLLAQVNVAHIEEIPR